MQQLSPPYDPNGDIGMYSDDGKLRIHIDGGAGNIYAGGNGCGGDISLINPTGGTTVHVDGGLHADDGLHVDDQHGSWV